MTRRVAFDASFLAALTDETTPVRSDAGVDEDQMRDRLAYLIERLDDLDADIVLPAPALAETLTVPGRDPAALLSMLDEQARFRVVPFDQRAAIECGVRIREGLARRAKQKGKTAAQQAKQRQAVKFDAMILAIALVEQATSIYSDDDDLRALAKAAGIEAYGFADLPARPEPDQPPLPGIEAPPPEAKPAERKRRSAKRRQSK